VENHDYDDWVKVAQEKAIKRLQESKK